MIERPVDIDSAESFLEFSVRTATVHIEIGHDDGTTIKWFGPDVVKVIAFIDQNGTNFSDAFKSRRRI